MVVRGKAPDVGKTRRIVMEYAGRVALVTGGARGIGWATVLRFAVAGFKVAVCDVNEPAEPLPEGSRFYRLDVTDFDEAEKVAAQVVAELGGLDVLVSNAGITKDRMLKRMTLAEFKAVIDVNLTGGWIMAKVCTPYMKAGGSIVYITSCNEHGAAGQTNYSASKAGLEGLARSLALELTRRSGIRVNAVAPGYTLTPMVAKMDPAIQENIKNLLLMQRFGGMKEIADAIYYVGVEATFMTGKTLSVDGGVMVLAA